MMPKPYYEEDGITIYCGDALVILPWLAEHDPNIDVVLTDPDYNGKNMGVHDKKYIGGMPHLSEEEYEAWCME